MPDPQVDPGGAPRSDDAHIQNAVSGSAGGNGAAPEATLQDIFQLDAPPTDDCPTIVSRPPRRAEHPEDAFAAQLRGRVLAHFRLIQPIGIGGMAAVIRAADT